MKKEQDTLTTLLANNTALTESNLALSKTITDSFQISSNMSGLCFKIYTILNKKTDKTWEEKSWCDSLEELIQKQ